MRRACAMRSFMGFWRLAGLPAPLLRSYAETGKSRASRGGLCALVGGLCELELEGGGLCFFAFFADALHFCGGVVDFCGCACGVEGVADEFVCVYDVEAGVVAGELDVVADGEECVVEAGFFCLVDGLVDFAVVGYLRCSDAEVFAVCGWDAEFRGLCGFGGVVFADAVEDGEYACHEGGEV